MGPEIREPRPDTLAPGPWDLSPGGFWDRGTGTLRLGTCNPGIWYPDTRDPGNGALGP